MPLTHEELWRLFDSPVPAQMMDGFDGEMAISPMLDVASLSKTKFHKFRGGLRIISPMGLGREPPSQLREALDRPLCCSMIHTLFLDDSGSIELHSAVSGRLLVRHFAAGGTGAPQPGGLARWRRSWPGRRLSARLSEADDKRAR